MIVSQEKRFCFIADLILPYYAIRDFLTLICTFGYPQHPFETFRTNNKVKFPNKKTKLGKLNQKTLFFIFTETSKKTTR